MSKRRTKDNKIYYLKQKLSGLALIVIGILLTTLTSGDITILFVTIPLGLYLIITNEKVMVY